VFACLITLFSLSIKTTKGKTWSAARTMLNASELKESEHHVTNILNAPLPPPPPPSLPRYVPNAQPLEEGLVDNALSDGGGGGRRKKKRRSVNFNPLDEARAASFEDTEPSSSSSSGSFYNNIDKGGERGEDSFSGDLGGDGSMNVEVSASTAHEIRRSVKETSVTVNDETGHNRNSKVEHISKLNYPKKMQTGVCISLCDCYTFASYISLLELFIPPFHLLLSFY
jgi:hypothetical protein